MYSILYIIGAIVVIVAAAFGGEGYECHKQDSI